jgi:MFS family permease
MAKTIASGRDRLPVRDAFHACARAGTHSVPERALKTAVSEPVDLRPLQLFFLAAAVFVVSAGYGSLLPLLPAWLEQQVPDATPPEVARHVGFLSGAYTAGVLVAAPVWGLISDRIGRPRILVAGLIGYVASLLLLLLPSMGNLWAIYGLRTAAGLFVAAVVPVVPALVAAHTPTALRARRFAWLGAASLLGFLFGPGLNALANAIAALIAEGPALVALSTRIVIVLAALLGASMMLGLALTLPPRVDSRTDAAAEPGQQDRTGLMGLLLLSVAVNFVLSGFELGIVLQGSQHAGSTTQEIAMMFAECSLVMLGVNALLFFTSLLDKVSPRLVIAAGSLIGVAGLALLGFHQSKDWMLVGVSLTSAGTGLVLPVISFLAAGTSHRRLGATMGSLAAAAGLGQTLGSSAGGWLFGAIAQLGFGWLALPMVGTLMVLLFRPSWWKTRATFEQVAFFTNRR